MPLFYASLSAWSWKNVAILCLLLSASLTLHAAPLSLKRSVTLEGLQPEITLAALIATLHFQAANVPCVITSAKDGRHKVGSLHYKGRAIDLRTRHLSPTLAKQLAQRIQQSLGQDFDVILEDTHLHIEYQPKRTLHS